jgi:hypothetical protein
MIGIFHRAMVSGEAGFFIFAVHAVQKVDPDERFSLHACRAGGGASKRRVREEANAAGGAAKKKRQRSVCRHQRADARSAGGRASARTSAKGADARSAGGHLPAPAPKEPMQGVQGRQHLPSPRWRASVLDAAVQCNKHLLMAVHRPCWHSGQQFPSLIKCRSRLALFMRTQLSISWMRSIFVPQDTVQSGWIWARPEHTRGHTTSTTFLANPMLSPSSLSLSHAMSAVPNTSPPLITSTLLAALGS